MSDNKRQMTVDFSGLLSLLGDRLYSDKRVFVREMIQNGSDSIVRRYGAGRAGQGRIDVEVVPSERRITFRDNGIGMDVEDIESDLSRIAASGTRDARQESGTEDLIGKHGIGFLSAFVVAERVRVRTRKQGAAKGWQWENENKLDYVLTEVAEGLDVGTTVDVFVSREHASQFVSDSAVRDILQRYCDMLRTPIFLNGSRNPINSQIMPWERDTADLRGREWETRSYLEKTFPDSVLETIHFDFREGVRASGVLYITTSRGFQFDPPRHVRLYQSRMLLSQNAAELLPKWATFINGMIDSPDIEPNAARDDFVRNNAAIELTEKFSLRIVEYLTELHRNKPERFKEIVQYHNLGLMAACWYHADLFEHFYDLLLWRVNAKPFGAGPTVDIFGEEEKGAWRTLGEILDRLAPGAQAEVTVPTISDEVAVAQYFEMADAADAVIVDASPFFAEDLLRKIEGLQNPTRIGGRRIRLKSVTEKGNDRLFQPLRGTEDDAVRSLAEYFDGKVADVSGAILRVESVHIKPESVVGVIRSSADVAADLADAKRAAANTNMPEYVRNVAKQLIKAKRRESIRLVLNAENPLVRKLAEVLRQARSAAGQSMPEREALFRELVPALYNIAILNSRAVLSQSAQSTLGQQIAAIVERLIDTLEEVRRLQRDVTAHEVTISRIAPSKQNKARDYVSVFYMTPFSDEFADVRASVASVIGRWGVKLTMATDSVHKELLIENLHQHIEDADAFIADITGLNPNVMLELGAVKFENLRKRPVVLLSSMTKSAELPADLRGQLYVDYRNFKGVELEEFLSNQLGRHVDFMKVLGNPARTKYLSAELLRSYIERTALNPEKFDIPRLVKAFPTDRHWQSATEAEVAKYLPEAVRRRAADILDAVQAGALG